MSEPISSTIPASPRQLFRDEVLDAVVSTMWLPPRPERRHPFETMILGGRFDDHSWTAPTAETAAALHHAVIDAVRAGDLSTLDGGQ